MSKLKCPRQRLIEAVFETTRAAVERLKFPKRLFDWFFASWPPKA